MVVKAIGRFFCVLHGCFNPDHYMSCVFFTCLCTMSKLAITSPMKRQLDPLEILRDIRQGGSTINLPIPHVILLSLCNLLMGASSWRMVLSGFTISVWWFNYHCQENYCKAISPALTIILAWECWWVWFSYPDVRRGYGADFREACIQRRHAYACRRLLSLPLHQLCPEQWWS